MRTSSARCRSCSFCSSARPFASAAAPSSSAALAAAELPPDWRRCSASRTTTRSSSAASSRLARCAATAARWRWRRSSACSNSSSCSSALKPAAANASKGLNSSSSSSTPSRRQASSERGDATDMALVPACTSAIDAPPTTGEMSSTPKRTPVTSLTRSDGRMAAMVGLGRRTESSPRAQRVAVRSQKCSVATKGCPQCTHPPSVALH
mmetsp:Transcript_7039/g.28499  ORF Transcript_7039/g.28499 Transcript_7039/m.28499 type:complete len:208 (-) Transcript_7039:71-694(-)